MRSRGLLVLALVAGCSWSFMDTVPEGYRPSHVPRCDDSWGLPLVDLLVAAAYGGATVQLYPNEPDCAAGEDCLNVPRIAAFILAVPALLHLASTVTGFVWTHQCAKAKRAHKRSAEVR